jgi:hypothetical protein
MLTHKDIATPNTQVILTELDDDQAVLLHLDTKMYFSLNATGLWIWKQLEQGRTMGEISDKLHDEFDVSPEQAEECVLKLVNHLHAEQLINAGAC